MILSLQLPQHSHIFIVLSQQSCASVTERGKPNAEGRLGPGCSQPCRAMRQPLRVRGTSFPRPFVRLWQVPASSPPTCRWTELRQRKCCPDDHSADQHNANAVPRSCSRALGENQWKVADHGRRGRHQDRSQTCPKDRPPTRFRLSVGSGRWNSVSGRRSPVP